MLDYYMAVFQIGREKIIGRGLRIDERKIHKSITTANNNEVLIFRGSRLRNMPVVKVPFFKRHGRSKELVDVSEIALDVFGIGQCIDYIVPPHGWPSA